MITHKLEGNKLVLTVDLSGQPYISKSAQAKADKNGTTAEAKAMATSGGFVRVGAFAYSLNVNKA